MLAAARISGTPVPGLRNGGGRQLPGGTPNPSRAGDLADESCLSRFEEIVFPQNMLMITNGLLILASPTEIAKYFKLSKLSLRVVPEGQEKGGSKNEGMSAEVIENTCRKNVRVGGGHDIIESKRVIF